MKQIFLSKKIILFTFFIFLSIVGGRYQRSKGKKNYTIFNRADIKGRIEYVELQGQGERFKVYGDPKMYTFFPKPYKNTKGVIFRHFAQRGDSIMKKSYSDRLIIYKDSGVFEFCFFNLDEK